MSSSLRQLPANYVAQSALDFRRKGRLRTFWNYGGFLVWLLCSGLLLWIAVRLQPDPQKDAAVFGQFEGLIGVIVVTVFVFGAMALHEGAHRVCYWLFTGVRPGISPLRGGVYYVAPPDCYLPKRLFLIVTFAPLMIWVAASVIAIAFIPAPTIYWVSIALAVNIAICTGDLIMITWALQQPRDARFNDRGPVITAWAPTL